MTIIYKCGFKDCDKTYECEEGFWARIGCKHKNILGESIEWYPVKILKIKGEK